MIDFERAGLLRQLLEEGDGRVDRIAVPEAVRGCEVQDSAWGGEGRERTEQKKKCEPDKRTVH